MGGEKVDFVKMLSLCKGFYFLGNYKRKRTELNRVVIKNKMAVHAY